MSPRVHRLLIYSLLLTLPFLLSGCFLRLLFGSVGERNTDFGIVFFAHLGGTFGPLATCNFSENPGSGGELVDCDYSFFDPEREEPFVTTSSAELREMFGVAGLFVDPLILQVPADATEFVATFMDRSITRTVVLSEATSFLAQPGTVVIAEAGQKFVILDFPAEIVADLQAGRTLTGPFDYDLEFQVTALEQVNVKPMYTGKVEVNGQVYYPPLLPCVTSFAAVPAVRIPEATRDFLLTSQLIFALRQGDVPACQGTVYDFNGGDDLPAKHYLPSVTARHENRVDLR